MTHKFEPNLTTMFSRWVRGFDSHGRREALKLKFNAFAKNLDFAQTAESLQVIQTFGRKNIASGDFVDQQILPVPDEINDAVSGFSLQTPRKLLKMEPKPDTVISIRIPSLHNTELAQQVERRQQMLRAQIRDGKTKLSHLPVKPGQDASLLTIFDPSASILSTSNLVEEWLEANQANNSDPGKVVKILVND